MIFLISLAAAAALFLLCAKPIKAHPAPFYLAAAVISGAVITIYWTAPGFLTASQRTNLPIWLSAFGTACFVFVMILGAMPNGHPLVKRLMPIRGEMSIFACLITLGHNLSFGKNYLTPAYLFHGASATTRAAAWISLVLIILMLVLTVTSIKAVRKRFQPKKWKALQRWAYLFYALIYVHVLLLSVPNVLKGRSGYGLTLVVYSVVFLGYALCRIQKAVLTKRRQAAKATGRRQLAAAGVGAALALLLFGGLYLTANSGSTGGEEVLPVEDSLPVDSGEPSEEPSADPSPSEEPDGEESDELSAESSEEPSAEPSEEPSEEPSADPAQSEEPSAAPSAAASAAPSAEPSAQATATPTATPTPTPTATPEPTPTPTPTPTTKYKDGTFTGTANGYSGPITVAVTISGDKITGISLVSYVDDEDYISDAKKVITRIVASNSTDVSTVSGATYSSGGIIDAVEAALKSAEN